MTCQRLWCVSLSAGLKRSLNFSAKKELRGWSRKSRPITHSRVLMGAGLAGRPPCLPHSQVLMGAGWAGRPPYLPHSQVLMGAGLAGRPPCLPHSQVLMGAGWAGWAGRPPCLPHSTMMWLETKLDKQQSLTSSNQWDMPKATGNKNCCQRTIHNGSLQMPVTDGSKKY